MYYYCGLGLRPKVWVENVPVKWHHTFCLHAGANQWRPRYREASNCSSSSASRPERMTPGLALATREGPETRHAYIACKPCCGIVGDCPTGDCAQIRSQRPELGRASTPETPLSSKRGLQKEERKREETWSRSWPRRQRLRRGRGREGVSRGPQQVTVRFQNGGEQESVFVFVSNPVQRSLHFSDSGRSHWLVLVVHFFSVGAGSRSMLYVIWCRSCGGVFIRLMLFPYLITVYVYIYTYIWTVLIFFFSVCIIIALKSCRVRFHAVLKSGGCQTSGIIVCVCGGPLLCERGLVSGSEFRYSLCWLRNLLETMVLWMQYY